ncbi:MAG: squalene--hopene cyclase [Gammaproteobacteria bacterium]|nr:MAG: squalene--hopene cyclase [Gammaproteobacteria bacterium]
MTRTLWSLARGVAAETRIFIDRAAPDTMVKSLSRWTSLFTRGTSLTGAGGGHSGALQRKQEATVFMLEREAKQPLSYRDQRRSREAPVARGERIVRVPDRDLNAAIDSAREALLGLQHAEGYWCFELEADCTISAEYILMMHFTDEIDPALQAKIAVYLRERQDAHGGWSLYPGGDFDISGSVKVYYALKLAGDSPDAPHMAQACEAILAHGGAAHSNVFTRIALALFEQVPWRAVPFIPVEMLLLPRWFPFRISNISYWSRTVVIPLAILCSLKARARNPSRVRIDELFTVPPEQERNYFPVRSRANRVWLVIERIAHRLEPLIPAWVRRRAIKKAEAWIIERLNGSDGLGAIFPAMVNAHEALALLGYAADHPYRITTKAALHKLLVIGERSAYCQPCVSPVWDTGLACLALHEANGGKATGDTLRALDWLKDKQLLDQRGDWSEYRPALRPGGWPFQFSNTHYPDLDDTALVAWVMHQTGEERYRESIERAAEWLYGMQSKNGGFASFDADNTHYYLNEMPFADHGALLDPPTADVSARCVTLLGRLRKREYDACLNRCLDYLRREQEQDGSWFGRWGTNYIYGTWSVLIALEQVGESKMQPFIRRAVEWLKWVQRADGGWGESNDSYLYPEQAGKAETSTAFQTAWAVLALMAAGETGSREVQRGAEFLLRTQQPDGLWKDPVFTCPGFPRVFYLKYHGYQKFFPLWALARYRNPRKLKAP